MFNTNKDVSVNENREFILTNYLNFKILKFWNFVTLKVLLIFSHA